MGNSDQRQEPDYMVVLDKIYEKDSTVAYPELTRSLEDFYQEKKDEGEEEMYREMRISQRIPDNKSLMPIPSMEEYEIYQSLDSLEKLGLIKEPEEIVGFPLAVASDDSINYVQLTKPGFEVAHDRRIRQRQQEILESQNVTSERIADLTETQSKSSRLLAVVTVLLGATAIIQATASVFDLSWPLNLLLGLVYIALLGLLWATRSRWYEINLEHGPK